MSEMTEMLDTPCPYCAAPKMPAPPKRGAHIHVQCPNCGAKPLAVFSDVLIDGKVKTHAWYVREHTGRGLKYFSVRWEKEQYEWLKKNGAESARVAMSLGIAILEKSATIDL